MTANSIDEARRVLADYSAATFNTGEPIDVQVSDLIADLLHVYRASDDNEYTSAKDVIDRAFKDYAEERSQGIR